MREEWSESLCLARSASIWVRCVYPPWVGDRKGAAMGTKEKVQQLPGGLSYIGQGVHSEVHIMVCADVWMSGARFATCIVGCTKDDVLCLAYRHVCVLWVW